MTLRVSGKNLDIGEALRAQVTDRVAGAMGKYFDGGYSGHVTVAKDGTGFRTDCVLHLTSGITIEASGAAQDAYSSFDQSAIRIEKRLRRYKQRLKEHANPGNGRENSLEAPYAVFEAPTDEMVGGEGYHPVVIAETTKPLHRLSVSDAVMRLDLTGVPALVFIHASTSRVNVVYRRGDGAIGWVDPPPAQP
ncbi:ribosome hibernation-promoting factor, HPF/YfiA family [Microvirga solisilvae]|uniref:ribosome hibernation-promoting factor, HPF/YfiA family n=1 Tax=Microvirga solisilvae TaxID=2919498 RepID=UPI001FAEE1ED|nr:ribosome-associated translation inhibitor RaiA [Microvirga solisilvae]